MTTPTPTYAHTDRDGDRLEAWQLAEFECEDPRLVMVRPGSPDSEEVRISVYLPKDPAELHKLTEAIHGREIEYIQYKDGENAHTLTPNSVGGRKVAAIVYEDELPEVKAEETERLYRAGGTVTPKAMATPQWRVKRLYREALEHLALARHIEARDAAAKEQERAEEERVRTKAQALALIAREAEGVEPPWHDMSPARQNGWLAVARHVLAGEEAGRG
ncbi:hypothetical protein [Jiangella asiatica]|uniref:Uncharacterized protein n=1 Tax=Jiangella asiatica TaxID=2530372 RepID=A0A4R5CS87_9ACTN|nr:hypothetical protein [Jiangella asiatica]TDE03439.1 hypothetical protein E1269_20590 [Jiangella asiatica]